MLKKWRELFIIATPIIIVNSIMDDKPIWINWKTIVYPHIREDSHHAEIIDINTGKVLKDTSIHSAWDRFEYYETQYRNRMEKRYKDKVIYRNDIGDCFCSTDWSKK